jgi:general secretion pathway protein M
MTLQEWWQSLDQRDRLLVGTGGGIVGTLLLYSVIWAPYAGQVDTLQQSLQTQSTNLQWMQTASTEVEQLRHRGSAGSANAGGGTSVTTLVERTSNSAGIQVKSWQPEGDNKVRVTLDAVVFDKVVNWLAELENTYKVKASLMTVQASKEPGVVDVRATLEMAAP